MKNTDRLKKQKEKKQIKRPNNLIELNKLKQKEKEKGECPYSVLFPEFKKKKKKNKK